MKRIWVFVTLIALALGTQAYAASPSAWITEGVTSVEYSFNDVTNTYTWVLQNLSGTPDSPIGSDLVLVWALQPFNIGAPLAWTAPTGWTWQAPGNGWADFEITVKSDKYTTPTALAPGESFVFTYQVDPDSDLINTCKDGLGDLGTDLAFLAHVALAQPDPNIPGQWIPVGNGNTWYDKSIIEGGKGGVAPEPSGLLAMASGLGLMSAVLAGIRRRSK